ncbi:replicative DNA helicase [Dactylosporangium sp. NPDC048998]|uniref:replicative DNA helicase n=1 Tax=Dactylosporangium sp. NPDC048998 TaxID=3363976 RepID=UPI0037155CFB
MSITEDRRTDPWDDAPPPEPRGGGDRAERPSGGAETFERTPPQDIAAEQSVLGGMLLSKDAVADVVEILKTNDFYKPAHSTIFDAILDLYGRGEPADAVTVAATLADSGNIAKIGGAPYLHTLMTTVPTAANASYYARIVAERAVLRRVIEAGTRIVQLGYGSGGQGGRDVDDVVDLAQQAIYDVTEKRVSEDFAVLAEMLQPTLDEIEAVGAQGGMMTGVPTGFSDLDRLLNGLHAGQLIIVAGRPGLGKALALDTPLPTPDGWTTMGQVKAGDRLLGADGRPTTVVNAFEVLHDRPCYEVEFSDGSVIVADAEHLWKTTTRTGRSQRAEVAAAPAREIGAAGVATLQLMRSGRARRRSVRAYSRQALLTALRGRVNRTTNAETTAAHPGTVTTAEIAATLRHPVDGRLNHAVENAAALQLPERDLPVPPHTLGAWLIAADQQIVATRDLRAIGVLGDKHIPAQYLRASERQRRELLAGLLGTDSTVTPTGDVRFTCTAERLANDVFELVVGLGYRCTMTGGATYNVNFTTGDARTGARFVVAVRPVPSVPVRCVQVDNADHLYLAGRAMIPTHNSTAAMDFSRAASVKHNMASAIFSLEMSKVEIVMRLLSAEARVPLHVLRSGQLSDDDWTKLARRMGEISEAPLFVDDTPNMNLMEIRAKARRLKQRHDLKLIVVDYLQLMTSPKRTESRQQEVADLSRGLKLLAKEVECPVVAVSQLNRGPEQRTDKRPQLSDLRESGCLTAGTRIMRADTNAETTIGELLRSGARDIPVWALNEKLQYVPRTMTHAFSSGRKEVFRMRLASGKVIEATANHPFLAFAGWTPLGELRVGGRIAVPRHVPPPLRIEPLPEPEVVLLAHLLGDGSRSHEKVLPERLHSLPKEQVRLFLRHLWATGGSVTVRLDGGGGRVHFASASEAMLNGIARLLLRFGITSTIRTSTPGPDRPRHTLEVSGRDDQLRFVREIGVHGERDRACERLRARLEAAHDNTTVDTIPADVWNSVRAVLLEQGVSHREFAHATRTSNRSRLSRIAAVLDSADLDLHATNDVCWDEIRSIESIGEQEVYDATVAGVHNFVANGIATHNSIEQDADVVILLHRDDYYDKESPRAGEADFIVAKHRNGPTDTVTVAAQLHLSRFVDMAI